MERALVAGVVARLLGELGYDWDRGDEAAHLFDDLGFDSFDGYELVAMVEFEFDLELDDAEVDTVFTVGDLVDRIVGATGGR
jgi:acyl carrier protein